MGCFENEERELLMNCLGDVCVNLKVQTEGVYTKGSKFD